ncbi:unnamed protein product, partial [marine sediment metagenome]
MGVSALVFRINPLIGQPPDLTSEPPGQRPRAREIGLRIGVLAPGPHNAITDVD